MDYFGEVKEDGPERRLKVKWPLRAVNSIEIELMEAMHAATVQEDWRAPMVFVDDDTWNADDYRAIYGELTAFEAMALREIIAAGTQGRFRRQLIIARELGPNATHELYQVACEVEGIDPIIRR